MKNTSRRLRTIASLLLAGLVLSACGGGGGGSEPTSPAPTVPTPGDPLQPPTAPGTAPASYRINGTISVLDTAAVDSDINDPSATYLSNDGFSLAQGVVNPVLLTGHLTFRGQGPAGPNSTAGDLVDVYRVRLYAGQTIELDFSADPSSFDIDLGVFDATNEAQPLLVGASSGTSRYECLRVVRDAEYFIAAEVFTPSSSGHSVYQLRISSPNSPGGTCAQATNNAASIIPGEIVAQLAEPATSGGKGVAASAVAPLARVQGMGLRMLAGEAQPRRMALYGLPAMAADRARQLSRLGTSLAPSSVVSYQSLFDPQLPPASRAVLETIAYAKVMQMSGQFSYAFPNLRMQSMQANPQVLVGTLPSNDRDYLSQRWHYDMISLPQAMQTLAGLSPQPTVRPIVAVVDTGIVANHADLARNIVGGYDFVSSVAASGDGNGIDANPDDSARASTNPSFHGSHVAGTVAAEGFNSIGGLGVAPMAQIMPLRVLGEGGAGSFYDILQAVMYAARLPNDSGTLPPRRADVINLSLGGDGACPVQVAQILNNVRAQGSVLVAASGNESSTGSLTPVGVPANCPGVIAVGAVDAQRGRAFYSNGGPELAVVAPGGDLGRSTTGNGAPDGIYSTVAAFQGGVRVPSYTHLMGTSMATPHVAGMLVIMRWVNPNLSATAIEDLVRAGTLSVDLGAQGWDNLFGQGLLNAKRAVDASIVSLGGGAVPPPAGRIEASPLNISLGATRSEAELLVQRVGATTETVASLTSNSPAVVVAPLAVDGNGLGTYRLTANRLALAPGQVVFASVIVSTSTGRTLSVAVDVENRAAGAVGSGSFGPIYVLAINGDTGGLERVGQADVARPVNGRYTYSIDVSAQLLGRPAPQRVFVIAGSDIDNDLNICNSGEACGAYPFLSNRLEAVQPRAAEVNGIDFNLSPFGGINPTALGRPVPLSAVGQQGGLFITKPVFTPRKAVRP